LESVRVVDSLASVHRAEWNALAGEQPFLRHEFLSGLIETGCATAKTGWLPQIVLLERAGILVGAMPLFAKNHSYGEYVFDWAWADAHERNGIDYYPKLVCAVPFTPVRGIRILAASSADRKKLIAAALQVAHELSSLHVLFARDEDADLLAEAGFLMRHTVQFHWKNEGYAGVTFRWLEGAGIEREHWEFFNRCYRRTYAAHRSTPYLNLDFFLRLGAEMPHNVTLLLGEREGKPVCASLLLRDRHTLYGRYWGSVEHIPLMHFECCYYQAIDYAISRKLATFEGGAQGEHKIFRGLMPVQTRSAHWLAHPKFARAVENFLERETLGIAQYVNELVEHSPFKEKG
jgi:predicted N-acyltransferase